MILNKRKVLDMQSLISAANARLTVAGVVLASVFYAAVAGSAHAAASPTTGIDYVSDLVTPVKAELTLAIVAGLGLMVVLIAVRAGTRLVKSFGK